jgi:hypothetical protein
LDGSDGLARESEVAILMKEFDDERLNHVGLGCFEKSRPVVDTRQNASRAVGVPAHE